MLRKSGYAREFLKFKTEFDRCFPRKRWRGIRLPDMEKGLISVVLPVYNGARYLEEAIRSVAEQRYSRWELLVVDDGSADESPQIAARWAERDGRIRLIERPHLRLPAALNAGFAAARGEFYTWTSADNRMGRDCLRRMAEFLRCHPGIDMVYGNMRLLDETGGILRGKGWYEIPPLSGNVCLPRTTLELNTYANNTIGAAFLYRARAAAAAGSYQARWFTMEDYDYFMRINAVGRIAHLPGRRPVYFYRMHRDSLTARDAELGITARRPKLMRLDRLRREQLVTPLCYDIRGDDRRGLTRHLTADPRGETVCGIAFDTGEMPDGAVKVYIADGRRECPPGFDLYLSFSEEAGCPWSERPEVLAEFLDIYCRGNCKNKLPSIE